MNYLKALVSKKEQVSIIKKLMDCPDDFELNAKITNGELVIRIRESEAEGVCYERPKTADRKAFENYMRDKISNYSEKEIERNIEFYGKLAMEATRMNKVDLAEKYIERQEYFMEIYDNAGFNR